SSLSTTADRSAACMADSPPFRLPTGVRTASTMTVSRICLLRSRYRPPTSKRRLLTFGERGIRLPRIDSPEINALRAGFAGERITQGSDGALVEQGLIGPSGRTGTWSSVAPRQAKHMRAQEVQNHLLTDRGDLHQPRFAEVPRHVVLLGIAHAAVCLQRPISRGETGVG